MDSWLYFVVKLGPYLHYVVLCSWGSLMLKLFLNRLQAHRPLRGISLWATNTKTKALPTDNWYKHNTPILQILHWVSIYCCIKYKLCLLTYQCIHGNAAQYLEELITPQPTIKHLCFTNTHLFSPRTKLYSMEIGHSQQLHASFKSVPSSLYIYALYFERSLSLCLVFNKPNIVITIAF